ncbi:MAG: hypothetical protein AAF585_06525 [Verrucomicrobiota bacterium]
MDGAPMPYDPAKHTGRLKRLDPKYYRGAAFVHWCMTIEGRKTGWLSELIHSQLREAMLHILARYHLICPVYCLMPDHAHFLLCGLHESSDQRPAMKMFRTDFNRRLKENAGGSFSLQKQSYDHVLTQEERERDAFEEISGYILRNPERAKMVEEGDFQQWLFLGGLAVGFPSFDPRSESIADFWNRFWTIYEKERDWKSTS